jgi:type IV pilus assembly protein PilQ
MKQFFNPARSVLRLAFAVLALWAIGANAEVAGSDANSILSLNASPAEGGKVVLKVGLKNALANQPAAFTINTPPRIAFDFPNTENGLGKSTQEFGEGDLRGVNVVQAGSRTRLVVNLNQMLSYDTQIDGNNLLITLQGKVAASSAEPVSSARFAEAKPGTQAHSLRDVDFRRGKNGEGRLQIDLSDESVGIDIKQQGKTLVVDFAKTSLPRNLQRKLDVTDFATPVQLVDAFAQGENTRLVIEPKGAWEYAAYQTDNKFIIEVKAVVEDSSKLAKGSSRGIYAGEKLSLNFQNISTREALNVIADFTNLNMVISDTVNGNLTLRLKDVPWDQALQIILDTRDLMQQKEGNVIMVAPREEIAARQKEALTTQRVISQLEPVQTEAFPLSYAKVEDVKAVLAGYQKPSTSATTETGTTSSEAGKSTSSTDTTSGGNENITFDSRTNTLYITAPLSRLSQIREIIKKLDVPVRQVLIEARFVEATRNFNRKLGGRLGYGETAPTSIGGGNTAQVNSVTQANLAGFPTAAGSLSLSLFNQAATNTLTLELAASELDETLKSIASPRIMTGDSTPATIKSGVQIPYTLPATGTSPPTTGFKAAELSLTVTPKITPDDKVTMKLDVKQDTVGTLFGGIPSINNKQVTTTVLVENGGTVVIGGVYTQDTQNTTNKVPLLGDIPLLGWLFKNDLKSDSKKELLIFITPKILKDSLNIN